MVAQYKKIVVDGKQHLEHRYIMERYLGRKLQTQEYVHHINGNKKDNRLENLTVMSAQEHNDLHNTIYPKTKICKVCGKEFAPPVNHRSRNTICSKECCKAWKKKITPFKAIKIKQFDLQGNYITTFSSIKEAGKIVDGFSTNIVKCLKGKAKSAYGYKWQYGYEL